MTELRPFRAPEPLGSTAGRGAGDAARHGDVYDPARARWHARSRSRAARVVDAAVEAAAKAGRRARRRSPRATQVLFAFREILNARKAELAAIITSEHGKVRSDALGEVSRGLEVVEFACGMPHLLKGGYSRRSRAASTSTRSGSRSVWSR